MSFKLAGRLLTQRRYLPLFGLFQAGTFNDNALKQALIALVTFGGVVLFTDSIPRTSVVPLAALLFTLPFLILCAIAGQIADKVDRGVILKWVKRVEVGLMVLAAIGFFLQSAAILAVTLVGMGSQSAFFSPTKNAVLPQWLKPEELNTGNGILSGFQFFFILLGQSVGMLLVLANLPASWPINGPQLVGVILVVLALFGWWAAENLPEAPAPKPGLKIDYNPITAIWSVLRDAWAEQNVLRPMLGIAWFYGLSTIFVTAFPVYVADVMMYDQNVLTFILVASTLGILVGSLACAVFAGGREAIGISAIGIIGVTIFTLDIYLNSTQSLRTEMGGMDVFLNDPAAMRFLIAAIGASICNGLFVVPLQAMAQRRARDENRARMMSAGSVLLNLSVNTVTFGLIGLGFLSLAPSFPFLIIVVVSACVALYAVYRYFQVRKSRRA